MSNPLMWLVIGGSTAMSAAGAVQQGRQADAQARAEADRMRVAGEVALRDASAQDEQFRQDARRRVGLQLAASAEAGGGINADSLRESIYGVEMDSAAIRYGALSRNQSLKDQANITQWQGRNAKRAGYLNAATTVLNAASSYYGGSSRVAAAKKGT